MKRHSTDWTSLIAGVTFCAIAIAYLSADLSHRSLEVRWMAPILLVGLGIAGTAGTVLRNVRKRPAPPTVEMPHQDS
jgi:hypothetical protein